MGSWRAQWNRTPLVPQNRFSIGGRYTVRGFDGESILMAERGWLIRNDLGWLIADSGQELYLGLDHGEVGGKSADLLIGKRLTGAVVGLRGGYGKLFWDLFTGWPLQKPENFQTAHNTTGFNLTLSF
jgi:hemolysin activation/secretion protein